MKHPTFPWAALCVAVPFTWLAARRTAPDVVRAGALEVVDERGTVRVRIGAADDEPAIAVFDRLGRIASSVTVSGAAEFRHVTLRTHRIDGSASLELHDEQGGDHGPVRQLRFLGEGGEDEIRLGHGLMERASSLSFTSPATGSSARLALEAGGVPVLALRRGRIPDAVEDLRAEGAFTAEQLEPRVLLEKPDARRSIAID